MRIYIYIFLLTLIYGLTSCGKTFLDTNPTDTASSEDLIDLANASPESLETAMSGVVSGLYASLYEYRERHDDVSHHSLLIANDLRGNDMVMLRFHWFGFDYRHDNRNDSYRRVRSLWTTYYEIIYNANYVRSFITDDIDNEGLKALLGQAYAMRAFAYFNLVQYYQFTYDGNQDKLAVPIYETAEASTGNPRSTVQQVYDLILSDLNKAYNLLANFTRPTTKSAIDKTVVAGLLARVYLVMTNWTEAAKFAKEAQTGYTLMSNDDYVKGFNDITNSEWIWGSDIDGENTSIFASFISQMTSIGIGYPTFAANYKAIDDRLYNQIPDTDIRKQVFKHPTDPLPTHLPSYVFANDTYKNPPALAQIKFYDLEDGFTADLPLIRVAEMYLIEAEAQARLGANSQAQDALYTLVLNRDPSYVKSTKTGDDLIEEIILHKRIELWGEGFGILELLRLKKGIDRTGSTNHIEFPVLAPGANVLLYQIPTAEIESNQSNLVQND